MNFWISDLFHILPEFYFVCILLLLLTYGVVYSTSIKLKYPILIQQFVNLSLIFLGFLFILYNNIPNGEWIIFESSLKINPSLNILKILLVCIIAINFLITSNFLKKESINSFEYVILVLLSVLGILLMISSYNLLTIFLSLELQSLSFYILTSYKRTEEYSIEAGLKYFIFGAFSTGLILFGFSLLYGTTGLFRIEDYAIFFKQYETIINFPIELAYLSILFIAMGLFFKLYAVPFHVWVPDVYQGSPTSITTLFATAPILGVISILLNFFYISFFPLIDNWKYLFICVSIVSMLVGAFAAIRQKKIKRLLAYSSIGHVGFILMGLVTGTPDGIVSLFFYILIYIVTMIAVFTILLSLRKENGELIEHIHELNLLHRISPALAISFAICLFSMAGIPPLAGFYSKLYVFMNAMHHSLYILLITGILTSSISAYYYLNIIKVMYFDKTNHWVFYSAIDFQKSMILAIAIFFLLFFFVNPNLVLSLCYKIMLSYIL